MISVIIPTFNRAAFLKEAISSVLEQDYFRHSRPDHSFELLVVDDGSEDDTREVIESFAGRATLLGLPHRGVSAARNLGLRAARGEFIAFLDSDDLWRKEKIGVQMGYMKAFPAAKVCYTEEIWMRRGKRLNPHRKHQKPSGWIFDRVLSLCLLSLSSCLFRREVFAEVGIFDEELPVCEDYDLGIRLAHRYPIHLLPRPLIIKRGGHPDQLSHRYWGMDRFRVQALEKALLLALTPEQKQLVKEELIRKCRILVRGFSRHGNRAEAARYRALLEKYSGGQKAGSQNQ
jgi:glycosyltransferase involved in cell wall biosynthesis